jgi:tetratricopeptide (TPR) repeat protein
MFPRNLSPDFKNSLIDSLTICVERIRDKPTAIIFQAEILWLRGDEAGAEELLRSIAGGADDDVAPLARLCLGSILADRDQDEEALEEFTAATASKATAFTASWQKAELHLRKGRTDDALESFAKALTGAVDPNLIGPFAEEYLKVLDETRGMHSAAVALLEMIATHGPNARLQNLLSIYAPQ